MSRLTLSFAILLAIPAAVRGDAAQDFLNTPVWYLSYQVSFKTTSQGSYEMGTGKMTYTATLDRVFTHTQVLNLRSQGPGALAMMPMAQQQNGGKTSVADAQKASMDLMAQMDHTANWMVAGSALEESQTEADVQADIDATVGELRIQFKRNEKGDGFQNELGNVFSMTRSETVDGTGKGGGGGFGTILLDVNTAKKTYLLSLGLGGGGDEIDREVVEVTQFKGEAPEEKRETRRAGDQFNLVLDREGAAPMGGGVVVSGTFDPAAGTIVGENSYPGHYHDGTADAPGTVVVKYTLSPTPPAKKAGKGK